MTCKHQWVWVKDWYGDPTIPYGTQDCSHWQSRLCDAMSTAAGPRRGDEISDEEIEQYIEEESEK